MTPWLLGEFTKHRVSNCLIWLTFTISKSYIYYAISLVHEFSHFTVQLMEVDLPTLIAKPPREHPSGWEFNEKYDGILGQPDENPPNGVWFSATLYTGQIPTQTPYPTGDEEKKYWRISIKANNFDLLNKDIFLYRAKSVTIKASTQNSLVFTKGKVPVIEANCDLLDKLDNPFFWFDEASGHWMCPKRPTWTKLCLTWDIDLTNDVYPNMFWDRVPKRHGV